MREKFTLGLKMLQKIMQSIMMFIAGLMFKIGSNNIKKA